MIRVTTTAGSVAADLAGMTSSLQPQLARITRAAGRQLQSSVKSHAPAVTGRYRRSWRAEFEAFPISERFTSTVGTDEPYGYRLEEGDDERPPQPHVEPALAEVGAVFIGQVEAAVRVWLARQPRR